MYSSPLSTAPSVSYCIMYLFGCCYCLLRRFSVRFSSFYFILESFSLFLTFSRSFSLFLTFSRSFSLFFNLPGYISVSLPPFLMPNNQISIYNVINVYLFLLSSTTFHPVFGAYLFRCSSWIMYKSKTYFISLLRTAKCGRKSKYLLSRLAHWVYCLCATKMTYYLTCLKLEHIFHLFFKHSFIHSGCSDSSFSYTRSIVLLFNFD